MAHTSYTMSDWLVYLSHAEIDLLKQLSQSLPKNPVVVNIGAGSGTSGLSFVESRPDLTLVTIDVQKEAHPTGSLDSERDALIAAGYWDAKRNFHIHGKSQDVAVTWKEWATSNLGTARRHVDLVFVDGDHTYAGCAADIVAWLPHLSQHGIIAVHDYAKEVDWINHNPGIKVDDYIRGFTIKPWEGVDRAVNELLLGKYPQAGYADSLIAFVNTPLRAESIIDSIEKIAPQKQAIKKPTPPKNKTNPARTR